MDGALGWSFTMAEFPAKIQGTKWVIVESRGLS